MTFLLVCFVVAVQAALRYELLPYEPRANASAVVVVGSARFTVLTDNVIRMEFDASGRFEDRATVAIVNRLLPVPAFVYQNSGSTLTIKTKTLLLTYQIGQPFTASSLTIQSLTGAFANWAFTTQQAATNLLGTIRSLDLLGPVSLNCSVWVGQMVNRESLHCEYGLISRDGWATIDDSTNWGLDSFDFWQSPNVDQVDLYFLGHGLDFKQALYDYSLLGGKTAMVPRYASGISWSRWYDLDENGVVDVAKAYSGWQMPLDTFILDMDWHTKYSWGGYSFDRRLFPQPSEVLVDILHDELDLAVSVNLHDDDGVRPYEVMYKQMCAAMGVDPASQQTIPFQVCTNRTYANALEDIVLADVERQGVDFMWIDWQQGGTEGGCQGGLKMNPTMQLQKQRATNAIRRGQAKRGIVLSRFGGLGAHRYQVGFSGDVSIVDWSTLAFQPYFSYTAANVLYGYWSHDIVGSWSHDHELHTRWIQWGSVSGHFRTHDRGMSAGGCANNQPTEACAHVAPWNAPPVNVYANRLAMQRREALVPYIYNAARQAFDTGIGLIYPMYLEWPQCSEAFMGDGAGNFAQYYFGADFISAPVVRPASNVTGLSTSQIWLPPGAWFDVVAGLVEQSPAPCGKVITRHYSLEDQPMFARAGAIVPRRILGANLISQARQAYTSIEHTVYPGDCGSSSLYEDDAETTSYLTSYSRQAIRCTQRSATIAGLTIDAAVIAGSFAPPSTRRTVLRFPGSPIATQVLLDNVAVPWARSSGSGPSWHYDARETAVVVDCGELTTSAAHVIAVTFVKMPQAGLIDGLSGIMNRASVGKSVLDQARDTPGSDGTRSGFLMQLASASMHMSARAWNATEFIAQVQNVRSWVPPAIIELQTHEPMPVDALLQLFSSARLDNCLCGTRNCLQSNLPIVGYQRLRIEGYQPSQSMQGVIPLNDWWSNTNADNLAVDSAFSIPATYQRANFANGWMFAQQQPGTLPLRLFWNPVWKDFLTVASPAGLAYAGANNFTDMNRIVGWVFKSPWRTADVDETRWNQAIALLQAP
jgi:alpha-glucosidase (family GH31 glycosyl hydrolase)